MIDAICSREARATRLADCLLAFVPSISAIVCKQCHYAVPADMLRTHLSAKEVHGFKLQLVRDMVEEVKRRYPRVASSTDDLFAKSFRPHPSIQPLPYLTVHSNCFGCGFKKSSDQLSWGKSIPDDAFCQFFAGSKKGMFEHYRKAHKWVNPRRRGRPCGKIQGVPNSPDGPWRTGITCQRLRLGPRASHLFQVAAQIPSQGYSEPVPTAEKRKAKRSSCSEIEESMLARLQEAEAQISEMQSDCALNPDQEIPRSYQRSPWLDLTRWPNYLSGIRLASVRALLILPERSHDYGHHSLADAEYDDVHIDAIISKALDLLDRLIEEARVVLTKDRLNVFDQHRLNSFYRGKSFRRPIFTKLMDGTYRKYKAVWKQLLCYVIRVCYFRRGPDIHFSMTREQILSLEKLMHLVRTSIDGHNTAVHVTRSERDVDAPSIDKEALRACLDLCIALLDHELKGDIYDSIVVGFLAAIGIDARNECFREAPNYSSSLSGLIKMAQSFVALRSIRGMDEGEADFASDLLDEMQDKFMVFGSRSPIEWALKLRAYCRAVRDTTTVYGSIVWSDDGDTVSFRDVGLHLPSFRWDLRDHLIAAQNTLAKLLLVESLTPEQREGVLPPLNVRSLKDDASIDSPGWSFLKDSRNAHLHGKENWILQGVCKVTELKNRYTCIGKEGQPHWERPAMTAYYRTVVEFLSQILLLMHVAGGQPARGTDLLTIQWRNSPEGYRRTVFMENGLVDVVISSVKGYTVDGSTRIIHRYLPPEVGELLIYYLLLVQPFCSQTQILEFDGKSHKRSSLLPSSSSSVLWSGADGKPWKTEQLRHVLASAFDDQPGSEMNVSKWRHIAIAVSRKHLSGSGFKKGL